MVFTRKRPVPVPSFQVRASTVWSTASAILRASLTTQSSSVRPLRPRAQRWFSLSPSNASEFLESTGVSGAVLLSCHCSGGRESRSPNRDLQVHDEHGAFRQHCACEPRERGVVVLVLSKNHTTSLLIFDGGAVAPAGQHLVTSVRIPPGRAASRIRAVPAYLVSRLSQPGQRSAPATVPSYHRYR